MELRETLVNFGSTLRAHQECVRDLGASVDAIYKYLAERDPTFAGRFERGEAEAQAEPSFRYGSSATIQALDRIIERLRDGEALIL
jgi:hypothetical protein